MLYEVITNVKSADMEYVAIITGFLVIIGGLWAILANKNLIRMIIGFSLLDTGTHIVIVSLSYVRGKAARITSYNVCYTKLLRSKSTAYVSSPLR